MQKKSLKLVIKALLFCCTLSTLEVCSLEASTFMRSKKKNGSEPEKLPESQRQSSHDKHSQNPVEKATGSHSPTSILDPIQKSIDDWAAAEEKENR